MKKKCARCGEIKEYQAFNRDCTSTTGRQSYCRRCIKAAKQMWARGERIRKPREFKFKDDPSICWEDYQRLVFKICGEVYPGFFRHAHGHVDVEDLVQDCYYAFLIAKDKFLAGEYSCQFTTCLGAIMRRYFNDLVRRYAKQGIRIPENGFADARPEEIPEMCDLGHGVEDRVAVQEIAARCNRRDVRDIIDQVLAGDGSAADQLDSEQLDYLRRLA